MSWFICNNSNSDRNCYGDDGNDVDFANDDDDIETISLQYLSPST